MGRIRLVESFQRTVVDAATDDSLQAALEAACRDMGFSYYALAHHVDLRTSDSTPIQIHNYPAHWAALYDDRGLGTVDPIRRASHRTNLGFSWGMVPHMLALTPADQAVLDAGRTHGLGDGYTIPAHIPGEVSASCSFVVPTGEVLPTEQFWTAQLIGALASACAQRISGGLPAPGQSPLTDRQRDCVLWVARGKTDWEIARILGISHETVIQHLKLARERYGVQKRTSLVILALFDGLISFSDIFRRRRHR